MLATTIMPRLVCFYRWVRLNTSTPPVIARLDSQTVVVLAIPLSSLKKLKFRRGASVTVILKTDEAKEFLTPQVGCDGFDDVIHAARRGKT